MVCFLYCNVLYIINNELKFIKPVDEHGYLGPKHAKKSLLTYPLRKNMNNIDDEKQIMILSSSRL